MNGFEFHKNCNQNQCLTIRVILLKKTDHQLWDAFTLIRLPKKKRKITYRFTLIRFGYNHTLITLARWSFGFQLLTEHFNYSTINSFELTYMRVVN